MVSSGLSTPTGVGASVGASGRRKSGKRAEGEAERQVREMGETFDRLVDTFSEDPVGKEKAKALKRVTP
jgi:syntaxin 8